MVGAFYTWHVTLIKNFVRLETQQSPSSLSGVGGQGVADTHPLMVLSIITDILFVVLCIT